MANVVPIHKKEEVTYVENYRPTSLLSFISIKYLNVAFLTTLNIIFTNRSVLVITALFSENLVFL